jgi:hypothetical protein
VADEVLIQLLVVQALLHSAEEGVVELSNVLLFSNFNLFSIFICHNLQYYTWIRILLVALGHLPEEYLKVADKLS